MNNTLESPNNLNQQALKTLSADQQVKVLHLSAEIDVLLQEIYSRTKVTG